MQLIGELLRTFLSTLPVRQSADTTHIYEGGEKEGDPSRMHAI